MNGRLATGGLYGSYRSNQCTQFAIDFWSSHLEDDLNGMHAQDVLMLLDCFRLNRQLHRDHMREKLTTQLKGVLLRTWRKEVECHQRLLVGLTAHFHELRWFDEEIWTKIAETASRKLFI